MGVQVSRPLPLLANRDLSKPPISPPLPASPPILLSRHLPVPSIPDDISTPLCQIPTTISHDIVPGVFTKRITGLRVKEEKEEGNWGDDSDNDDNMDVEIRHKKNVCEVQMGNSYVERRLLYHGLLGVSPMSAMTVELNSQGFSENMVGSLRKFEDELLCLNLYAIGQMLGKSWGYVVVLEQSGYFGFGGLEVWVESWVEGVGFWSGYLMGIGADGGLGDLVRVLKGVGFGARCLGVVCREGVHGAAYSRVLAEVWRMCGRGSGFEEEGMVQDLTPGKVFGMTQGEFGECLGKWEGKMRRGMKERVLEEWKEGKKKWVEGSEMEWKGKRERFVGEWGLVEGGELLKGFLGVISCGYLVKDGQGRTERGAVSAFSDGKTDVESVLHARQFLKMREALLKMV